MFENLSGKAHKEVLEFYGYDSPEDGNFDVVPLFILEKEEEYLKEQWHEHLQGLDSDFIKLYQDR